MNENPLQYWDKSPGGCEAAERRREPRFDVSIRVEMEIQQCPGQMIQGTVLEVSRCGLRLELPLVVEVGMRVTISVKHVMISGEVMHCGPAKVGYNAGILVTDVSGPERFEQLDDCELDLYAILVQMVQLDHAG